MASFDWYKQSPTQGAGHAYGAAWDSDREVTVFFGGGIGGPVNSTYEWDGVTMDLKTPAHSPLGRRGMAFAYDKARQETVLFGGSATSPLYNADTWVWNGTDWTQKSPAHSPSVTADAAGAYDPIRQVVLKYGRLSSPFSLSQADFWSWDGTDWTEIDASAPPGPRGGGINMCWDSENEYIILYGGCTSFSGSFSTFTDAMWKWDGTTWTELFPANKPGVRGTAAMGSIEGLGVFLYGTCESFDSRDNVYSTWHWNGTDWVDQAPLHNPSEGHPQLTSYLPESPGSQPVFFVSNEVWNWTPPPDEVYHLEGVAPLS